MSKQLSNWLSSDDYNIILRYRPKSELTSDEIDVGFSKSLVNDRLLEGKPTIISTNLTVEDLSRRYSPQIASRLRGSFMRVAFLGDDIRVKKNWGM